MGNVQVGHFDEGLVTWRRKGEAEAATGEPEAYPQSECLIIRGKAEPYREDGGKAA